jgi:hypothetical protein
MFKISLGYMVCMSNLGPNIHLRYFEVYSPFHFASSVFEAFCFSLSALIILTKQQYDTKSHLTTKSSTNDSNIDASIRNSGVKMNFSNNLPGAETFDVQ